MIIREATFFPGVHFFGLVVEDVGPAQAPGLQRRKDVRLSRLDLSTSSTADIEEYNLPISVCRRPPFVQSAHVTRSWVAESYPDMHDYMHNTLFVEEASLPSLGMPTEAKLLVELDMDLVYINRGNGNFILPFRNPLSRMDFAHAILNHEIDSSKLDSVKHVAVEIGGELVGNCLFLDSAAFRSHRCVAGGGPTSCAIQRLRASRTLMSIGSIFSSFKNLECAYLVLKSAGDLEGIGPMTLAATEKRYVVSGESRW